MPKAFLALATLHYIVLRRLAVCIFVVLRASILADIRASESPRRSNSCSATTLGVANSSGLSLRLDTD